MNIKPVSSPHAVQQTQSNAAQAKARAVEAFNKASAIEATPMPEHHSVNPNNISPEEVLAVKPQTAESTQKVDSLATPEATKESKEAPAEKDPELVRQFSQLERRERALRAKAQQQEQAIKAREQAIAAKEEALRAKEQEYNQGYISKDQLKQDTLRILADNGVSWDELTQQILNQQSVDPRTEATIRRLEAKIQQLEEGTKKVEKSYEEQQQQAYRAAIKQIELDVRATVQNDPNFETIKATKSIPDVVELIEETYKKDGVLLTVEEACNEVENYLMEEALKITRIGKIKKRLEQNGQTVKADVKIPPKPQQTQQMKTLTNAAASTRKLSPKERAILAFKGELKQ